MSDETEAAIRERWAAATPGPWEYRERSYWSVPKKCWCLWVGIGGGIYGSEATERAIAHAPTDIADLLAEVERLRAEVEHWRAAWAQAQVRLDVLTPSIASGDHPGVTLCVQCGFNVAVDEEGCCVTCGADAAGEYAEVALGDIFRLQQEVARLRARRAEVCDCCEGRGEIRVEVEPLGEEHFGRLRFETCGACSGTGAVLVDPEVTP